MAIFNYGNGMIPNYGYGYNNGNMSSTTNIVNGVAVTQNVINLGGNSACSNGPSYCQEGYSIYVPCLKNITRGQKVCFNMYIADKENQDTLDLSDLCGLTLNLSGPFGCPYGEYTWPDDINVLQREELSELQCERFNGNIVNLKLGYIEVDLNRKTWEKISENDVNTNSELDYNVDVRGNGSIGSFYVGEKPRLEAYDSPTHIFVGWTTDELLDDLCENFLANDVVVSTDNVWEFEDGIQEDINLYAVYRRRETYTVRVSFDNRHSYFNVIYNGETTMLSDKERDIVEVKEGYHFIAECKPLTTKKAVKDEDGNYTYVPEKTYVFYNWEDGLTKMNREYYATPSLFTNGVLKLRAFCDNLMSVVDDYNLLPNEITPTEDYFTTNLPTQHELTDVYSFDFEGSENISEFEKVKQTYILGDDKTISSYISVKNGGYIKFDTEVEEGSSIQLNLTIDSENLKKYFPTIRPYVVELNDLQIEDGVKKPEPVGRIIVKNGMDTQIVEVTSLDSDEYIFEFESCEDGTFEIYSSFDELNIVNICVFEKIIINKGEIELCIPPEDTIKFYVGVLNVSGAICVNDNWWGLDSVQLGVVNKLNPISINIE